VNAPSGKFREQTDRQYKILLQNDRRVNAAIGLTRIEVDGDGGGTLRQNVEGVSCDALERQSVVIVPVINIRVIIVVIIIIKCPFLRTHTSTHKHYTHMLQRLLFQVNWCSLLFNLFFPLVPSPSVR